MLDDVADPADLRGLWPPDSPLGQALVTTRRRDAALTGTGRRLVEVGLFTPAEAVAYLAETLTVHDRTAPEDQLTALAADLGHLPLALSQAAAYLTDAGITIPEYRELLADRATALAETAPDALPDDQHHATAAALTLSLDRADALRPRGLARPMLQLAAFLDPNGIPQAALTSTPALAHLTAHRTPRRHRRGRTDACPGHRVRSSRRLARPAPAPPHRAHPRHSLSGRPRPPAHAARRPRHPHPQPAPHSRPHRRRRPGCRLA
ncbi:hypothetical protein [Streptomyces sp. NPDC053431]|uniref:hypothetical protein n=1 Tax=Streptomyces sp. NPDC053431 TaxID=3365703 RepID=UPI0037D8A219